MMTKTRDQKGDRFIILEECLDLASSIRVVSGELSERLGQALKDEAELSKALSTLMNHKKTSKALQRTSR